MEKVIITAAQAEAIQAIESAIEEDTDRGVFRNVATVIAHKLSGNTFAAERAAANELGAEVFIAAMTVGYEVEKDPLELAQERLVELAEWVGCQAWSAKTAFLSAPRGSQMEVETRARRNAMTEVKIKMDRLIKEVTK